MHPFNTKLSNNKMHKSVESLSWKKIATVIIKKTELFDGKSRDSGNCIYSSENNNLWNNKAGKRKLTYLC